MSPQAMTRSPARTVRPGLGKSLEPILKDHALGGTFQARRINDNDEDDGSGRGAPAGI
jgi:hypothetical protein